MKNTEDKPMIKEGDRAPDFTLTGIDKNGEEKTFSLKDLKGGQVVVYFYPKDNTPGCTQEACDFRDNMSRVAAAKNVAVLGISPDSVNSHQKFREDHGLTFPLLCDPDRKVAELYGAYGEKKLYGKVSKGIIRSTFLVDERGIVKKLWRNVNVKGHVDEVLGAV